LGFVLEQSVFEQSPSSLVKPHFVNLIIDLQFVTFIIEERTFVSLLVFFVSQKGISLLGKVNRISDTIDGFAGIITLNLESNDKDGNPCAYP
jgi:hypothetical protein